MRQYQKLLSLAAVVTATVLTGCASRQPSTVVVVPQSQASTASQAAAAIRSGTVVAVSTTNAGATASQSAGASGGTTMSSTSAAGQLLTVQFDDGQRQIYSVSPGGQQFQVGDKVTVNTTQGMPVISH